MANGNESAKPGKGVKPNRPHKDFPLFPHGNGQWAKKIRRKLYYFGPWDDPQSALALYLDQKDDLIAGRKPRIGRDGFTIRDLCNHFLTDREHRLEAGEITLRTFHDYERVCKLIIDHFGKTRLVDDLRPDDFNPLRATFAKRMNPVSLGNEVSRVRVVFNFAYHAAHVENPIRFGPTFRRPSRKTLRKSRQSQGLRMFEARHIRRMLKSADDQLKAMILLAINCGFGNSDCANLPKSALDLRRGWLDFPRPKTAIERTCPLWPETTRALKAAIENRSEPIDELHQNLVFITKYGQSWGKQKSANPISAECRKLLQALGIHRPGLGFYALRHTFETVGGDSRDQVAVDHIMGHARNDMASVYRERINPERLVDVTDDIHRWLFRRNVRPENPR